MSAEPLASAPSVGTCIQAEPADEIIYDCDVFVEDGKVGDLKFRRRGGQECDDPSVPPGSSAYIFFVIRSKGYCFENLSSFQRSQTLGSFEFDFDENAPESQRNAEFRFPPALKLELATDRQGARLAMKNCYHHRDAYLYSLKVSVVAEDGTILTSPDPTLIEEPYEPPGSGGEWPPRRS